MAVLSFPRSHQTTEVQTREDDTLTPMDDDWEDYPASFSTSPPPVLGKPSPPLGTSSVQVTVPGAQVNAVFGGGPLLSSVPLATATVVTAPLQTSAPSSAAAGSRSQFPSQMPPSQLRKLTVPVTTGLQPASSRTTGSTFTAPSSDRRFPPSAPQSWWGAQAAAAPVDTVAQPQRVFGQTHIDDIPVDDGGGSPAALPGKLLSSPRLSRVALTDDDLLDDTDQLPAAFSETARPGVFGTLFTLQ